MTRVCTKCNTLQDIEEFYRKGYYTTGKVRRQSECKTCYKQTIKDIYDYKVSIVNEYKSNKGCKKCGCSKHYLLDFHHLDRSKKDFEISSAARHSVESIMEEIKKCIILCANCHREFHYLERHNKITIEYYLDLKEEIKL